MKLYEWSSMSTLNEAQVEVPALRAHFIQNYKTASFQSYIVRINTSLATKYTILYVCAVKTVCSAIMICLGIFQPRLSLLTNISSCPLHSRHIISMVDYEWPLVKWLYLRLAGISFSSLVFAVVSSY